MSDHHVRTVCSCGAVISQCRCPAPKTDTVIEHGCAACRGSTLVAEKPAQKRRRPA